MVGWPPPPRPAAGPLALVLACRGWGATFAMTRDDVRLIVKQITGASPADDEVVVMTSLQQLEFAFAIEEELEFRHEVPEIIRWKTVNDVAQWLREKEELTDDVGEQ